MTSALLATIGATTVTITPEHTITRFADGTAVHAAHEDIAHVGQAVTAQQLGYPDVRSMNQEHDLYHTLLAHWLGLSASPTLRAVADGTPYAQWAAEEQAVLALQHWAQTVGVRAISLVQLVYKEHV